MKQLKVRKKLFQESRNCWKISFAAHATLLIDCADFYRAIHRAISKAQRSVFILGWEIDSQTRLLRGQEEKESTIPSVALELLKWKAKQNPNLNIYLCRWDASVVFVTDREFLPEFVWSNNTPENVHICLDGQIPMGGSQHQKIILIDDELVFTGGMDIARQRWDERDHRIIEPERFDVLGSYSPYHDVQIMMDGPIVKHFSDLVRDRWKKSAGYTPIEIKSQELKNFPAPSWPENFKPQVKGIECSVARTIPMLEDQKLVQEVRRMYLDLIDQAEDFIYIENQFLTLEEIALAVNKRLREKPRLKVLMVSSYEPQGLFERESFWAGRIEFKKLVENNISKDRVRMTYPSIQNENGKLFYKRIHSKIFIVDDRYLTVASSNLNHRSMILDSECDVTLIAKSIEHSAFIKFVRNDLLAEHTGRTVEEMDRIFQDLKSLNPILESTNPLNYSLKEVEDAQFTNQSLKSVIDRVADPEEPLMSYLTISEPEALKLEPFTNPKKHKLAFAVFLGLFIIGIVFYLRSHSDWFQPAQVRSFLECARNSSFSLPLVCLVYVVGGFILFPVTVLSLLTAAVFGAILGPLYGMIGSLLSAALMFWIGNVAGLKGLRKLFGDRIRAIDQKFQKSGIVGVATLRFLPIAPFSLVNLAAGISSVTFFDFMAGTFLGFLPGLAVKGLVGDSLVQTLISPNPLARRHLILGIILWLGLAAASYFLAKHWRKNHPL